jgi:PadR family transcriptional regulator, regulatory protein PadR
MQPYDSQALGRRVNELLLLSVLRREPAHGYQLALEVEARSGGFFRFNHGTLYPILHKLEQEGLIKGDWTDPEAGRARKRYGLTEAGRTYLEDCARQWRVLDERLERFLDSEDGGDEQVRAGAA